MGLEPRRENTPNGNRNANGLGTLWGSALLGMVVVGEFFSSRSSDWYRSNANYTVV